MWNEKWGDKEKTANWNIRGEGVKENNKDDENKEREERKHTCEVATYENGHKSEE